MDDDSDILRGEVFFFLSLRLFHRKRQSSVNDGVWNFFCFSTQAVGRGYLSLEIKGEAKEEKVSPLYINWDAVVM